MDATPTTRADLVSDAPLAAAVNKHIASQPLSCFYFPPSEVKPGANLSRLKSARNVMTQMEIANRCSRFIRIPFVFWSTSDTCHPNIA